MPGEVGGWSGWVLGCGRLSREELEDIPADKHMGARALPIYPHGRCEADAYSWAANGCDSRHGTRDNGDPMGLDAIPGVVGTDENDWRAGRGGRLGVHGVNCVAAGLLSLRGRSGM